MGTGELNAGCNPAMDWHPIQGGVEILPVASCYRNRDELRPDGPLGSYADFTLHSDVICDLLVNRRKATWDLFINLMMNSAASFPGSLILSQGAIR